MPSLALLKRCPSMTKPPGPSLRLGSGSPPHPAPGGTKSQGQLKGPETKAPGPSASCLRPQSSPSVLLVCLCSMSLFSRAEFGPAGVTEGRVSSDGPSLTHQARRSSPEPLPSLFHLPAPWGSTQPSAPYDTGPAGSALRVALLKWVAGPPPNAAPGDKVGRGRPLSFRSLKLSAGPSPPPPPPQLTNSMMSNFSCPQSH